MFDIAVESNLELADLMHDIWLHESGDVACIADYETTRDLLSCLILSSDGSLPLNEIELHEDMDEEYLLVLDDLGLWVYYMKVNDDYMIYDHDVLFISNDCNAKVLNSNLNEECTMLFFSYGDEEDECCCCECCEECENSHIEEIEDGSDVKGFSFSASDDKSTTTYSFYSTDDELVERMRSDLLKIWK